MIDEIVPGRCKASRDDEASWDALVTVMFLGAFRVIGRAVRNAFFSSSRPQLVRCGLCALEAAPMSFG